jgi:betaine-aldehyde dehydrogenase
MPQLKAIRYYERRTEVHKTEIDDCSLKMRSHLPNIEDSLPTQRELFYNGQWHKPLSEEYRDTYNPGNGTVIFQVAQAGARDVDAAVQAAHKAFPAWRSTSPSQRAGYLRQAATVIREHAAELALLDALNTGNPVAEMLSDAPVAAANLEYFAGLIPMVKGETIPQSVDDFHTPCENPLGSWVESLRSIIRSCSPAGISQPL